MDRKDIYKYFSFGWNSGFAMRHIRYLNLRYTFTSLSLGNSIAIAFLGVLSIGLLAVFIWFAAQDLDESKRGKQMALVRQGLSSIITTVVDNQAILSIWDEAAIRSGAHDERWLAEKFGGWARHLFGYDHVYIFDAQDQLVFSSYGGAVITPAAFQDYPAAAEKIVTRLRARLADGLGEGKAEETRRARIFVTDVSRIGGRPAILSARPILPHTDRITVDHGREYIFLVVKYLDETAVGEIARQSNVLHLRYEPLESFTFESPHVGLGPEGGSDIGYLVWTPDRPGLRMLKKVAPWVSVALVIAVGAGFYQARSLRRSSFNLHASELRARHLALHDALTGLPNRALLEERLKDAMWKVDVGLCELALFLVDLDSIKNVEDTFGRSAADTTILQSASRLAEVVGKPGIVAHVGGDEFALLIEAANAFEEAKELSERALSALAQPIHLNEGTICIDGKIGVAIGVSAKWEPEELLRKAAIALHEAKRQRRGGFQIFSEEMDHAQRRRRQVEDDLRGALAAGKELRLDYQPLYSAAGQLVGVEALLGWNHSMYKSLSTRVLMSIAEECGLITQVSDYVLNEVCRLAANVPLPSIALNVSTMQLLENNFSRRFVDIIAKHNVAPERIQLEITEDVFIDDPEIARETLQSFKHLGIRLALDDFGLGYSSIGYLQECPLDRLKIGRLFVQALSNGVQAHATVAAMIDMAHALALKITAVGVETAEQRDILTRMGCDEMQGDFFSRPVSDDVLAKHFFAEQLAERKLSTI